MADLEAKALTYLLDVDPRSEWGEPRAERLPLELLEFLLLASATSLPVDVC